MDMNDRIEDMLKGMGAPSREKTRKDRFEGIILNDGQVVFKLRLCGKKGSAGFYQLVGANGKRIKSDEFTVKYDDYLWVKKWHIGELIEVGGEGDWKMEWYIGGNLAGSTELVLAII